MTRVKYINYAAWLILLLSACSTLGVPPADTFNKQVVQANGLVEVIANMVPLAYDAGKIDQNQARGNLRKLRDLANGIDTAVLIRATKPAEADAILAATITALTVLKSHLEERSNEP